ncbi:hypothetical protein R1flu_027177 [Riccia fluitans]|uniref:Ubiquitin-like protease family profile domain-containing protein n=1 Tax=Riccia fluitans TaxID=41844 RepID=A0ABD1XI18_9MARC
MVPVEVPSSPESPRAGRQAYDDWKSYDDLTKEDIDSTLKPGAYIRGDVINFYIKEKFLVLPRGALYGKFFVNTFWFSRVKTLTDKLRNDRYNVRVNRSIHRMRSSINPRVDDVQHISSLIIPIHFGDNDYHWSLAVIHLGKERCTIYHLDSYRGTHNSQVVTRALSLFAAVALNRSPEDIYVGEYYTPQQTGNYECGYHVMQFLSKVAEVKGDLGPYFDNESACHFATSWDVKSFEICFHGAMDPKAKNRFLP